MSNDAGRKLAPHAQLAAFARAVNLTVQDAPAGFSVKKRETKHKTGNAAFEGRGQYKHCVPFESEVKPEFKQQSPKLAYEQRLRSVYFNSEVEVQHSVAALDAAFTRGLKALNSASTTSCLQRAFDALGAHAGVTHIAGHAMRITVGGLQLVPMHLPPPAAGLSRSEGFSMSISALYTIYGVRGRTIRVPLTLYFDALTFGTGRAQVSLNTTGVGSTFPVPLEEGLFKLLERRALAARGAYPAIG